MEYLFVYGTLMKKFTPNTWSEFLQKNAKYVCEASISGKLYLVQTYPALIKGNSKVYGELYELSNPKTVLPILDEYEDYRPNELNQSLYLRELHEIELTKKRELRSAWVYFFNQSVNQLKELKSGKFINHL